MGYPLYREVKRYAPDDLDTGELALLLILADEANDQTRECFPGMDELCTYMRMTADGIGRILQRLAKRGIELRAPVGKDKNGRVVYARKGVRTTYVIPRFGPLNAANGRTTVRANTTQRADHGLTNATDRPDAGPGIETHSPDHSQSLAGPASGPSPQLPHEEEDPHLLPPQRILRQAGLALGDEDEKKLIDWANKNDRKGPAWWRTLARNGDLPDLVATWRAEATTAATVFGNVPPPWCGYCNDGWDAARFNVKLRLVDDKPCPQCHPDATREPQRTPAPRSHTPWRNPTDQSVYLKGIS